MRCDFRWLRVEPEIVYGHALKLRHAATHPLAGRREHRHTTEARTLTHLRESFPGEPLPDLEHLVARWEHARAPRVASILHRIGDALEAVARSRLVLMDLCVLDPRGQILVGTSLPGTAHSVRAGDDLLSGAYLYADLQTDTAVVGARFLRPARWSAFALPGRPVDPEEDVGRILRRSASRRLQGIVTALQSATWIPVAYATAALGTLGVHVPAAEREPLRALYERGRERTLYAAIGALADLARTHGAAETRMQLERLVGDAVLACVPLAGPDATLLREHGFVQKG